MPTDCSKAMFLGDEMSSVQTQPISYLPYSPNKHILRPCFQAGAVRFLSRALAIRRAFCCRVMPSLKTWHCDLATDCDHVATLMGKLWNLLRIGFIIFLGYGGTLVKPF